MMKLKTLLASLALSMMAAAVMAQQAPTFSDDATYQGLGGKDGVARISQSFVAYVQKDPRIADAFKDFDMAQLDTRLQVFLCEYSGGPCKYTGQFKDKTMDGKGTVRDMTTVHGDMKSTNLQFNAVTECLQQAMVDAGVAPAIQWKLIAKLAPLQRVIVTQ
jgi:hemoglobin